MRVWDQQPSITGVKTRRIIDKKGGKKKGGNKLNVIARLSRVMALFYIHPRYYRDMRLYPGRIKQHLADAHSSEK